MPRALRLLVGAVLALFLVGLLAQGIQYVYVHYAKSAESGLLGLLEYLFTPRTPQAKPPAERSPLTEEIISACAAGDLPDDYFSTISTVDDEDAILRRIYSKVLCAMGELPLASPGSGQMRIRLLWLPASVPGGSVRIEHSDVESRGVVIELVGNDRLRNPIVAHRSARVITPVQWSQIEAALKDASFWTNASFDPADGKMTQNDAIWWLLEVSEPGRYHMIHRKNGKPRGDLPSFLWILTTGL